MTETVLFVAVILLWIAIAVVGWDFMNWKRDNRAFMTRKGLENFGTTLATLNIRTKGQGNMIENLGENMEGLDARLTVLEAAMIADCEDCEDDEGEAIDIETMDTTGNIRSIGDVPADVLADPQRFDGGTSAVDVSGVLGDRGTAGGTSAPVTPAYGDGFRLKGEQFDRAMDEMYRR